MAEEAPESRCKVNGFFSFLLLLSSLSSSHPTVEELTAPDAQTVRSITIEVGDVFDLEDSREDGIAYRFANRLHRNTRQSVVRQRLLFEDGDIVDLQILAEAERVLRQSANLSDAQIEARSTSDHQVDLLVKTRDTWSLSGGFSFGRKGGTNRSSFQIRETNFLGSGKKIVLRKTYDVDRDQFLARYEDPNLFGSRYEGSTEISDNSDGQRWQVDLGLPFFALDSRRSLGLKAFSDQRTVSLYHRGNIVDSFEQESRHFEIYRGFSAGLIAGRTHRWTFGLTFEEERFPTAAEGTLASSDSPPTLVDRTFAYPWIDFERVGSAYLETQNVDHIGRTEDHYLGTRFHARLGFSTQALGGDLDRVLFEADLSNTREFTNGSLLDLRTGLVGRWANTGFENMRWNGDVKYHRRVWGHHQFFASLNLTLDHLRDADSQLLLGGDSGLRGYPLRFQDGDQRFLLSLEQRFYTPWSLLRIADIGAAVFFDIGRAWANDLPDDPGSGALSDIGIGLRLGLNRSSEGSVLHLDLAMPLNDTGDDSKSLQWLASTRTSF